MTPYDHLARAGRNLAKGVATVAGALLILLALIWVGGSESGDGPVKLLLGVMILVPIYFLPSFAAQSRRHSQRQAIFVLNTLLGWTFLGWAAAMVWAYTQNNNPAQEA